MYNAGRCGSCRWWENVREGSYKGAPIMGECWVSDSMGGGGPCMNVEVNVDDDSGLHYQLQTSPDFGCVLWAAKEK